MQKEAFWTRFRFGDIIITLGTYIEKYSAFGTPGSDFIKVESLSFIKEKYLLVLGVTSFEAYEFIVLLE